MILVLGATGTVGHHVVQQLVEKGAPVRVFARNADKARKAFGDRVAIAQGDFAQPETLQAAMQGVDKVFLLSPPAADQVAHQHAAIEAAKKAGVKHVVKLSGHLASPSARASFLRWHAETEQELQRSGLAWTILRPPVFMGNFLGMAGTIAQGAIYAPIGQTKLGFIDTRDIAAVAVAALTGPGYEGKIVELTGPEALSFAEAARIIGNALGKPVNHVQVPPEGAIQGMIGAGLPEWLARALVDMYADIEASGDQPVAPAVREATGGPGRTLEAFVREHAGAFKGVPAGAHH